MNIEKPRKPRAPRKSKAAATGVTDDMNTRTAETNEASTAMEAVPAPQADTTSKSSAIPTVAADTLLHLGAGLEVKDVESVHKQLTSMLERGPSVTLDISHIAAMDTAGVQLLLAFQSEATKRGVTIDYSGRSNAFTHALTTVGLGDAIRHVASRD